MRKLEYLLLTGCAVITILTGCGSKTELATAVVFDERQASEAAPETEEVVQEENSEETQEAVEEAPTEETPTAAPIEDGVYQAVFDTDSSMFHVNEAYEKKGTLTVENGEMTIHVSLAGTGILNLYLGMAEDAQKDGAVLLEPTTDVVTYSDGTTEEVNGFDIPVPYLDEEFDVALIGSKGKWYDHKVSVSDVQPLAASDETAALLEDGGYLMDVTLTGGSGKATVESPTRVEIKDGAATAIITWSSPNYDYMLVDGEKYLPVNTDGNSTFEIPIAAFNEEIPVIADTVAMSTPHEIEYTLNFNAEDARPEN